MNNFTVTKQQLIDRPMKPNIMDEPITERQNWEILQPTPYQKPIVKEKSNQRAFIDWILSYVPPPIKSNSTELKKKIKELYSNQEVSIKQATKGFFKTFTIEVGYSVC